MYDNKPFKPEKSSTLEIIFKEIVQAFGQLFGFINSVKKGVEDISDDAVINMAQESYGKMTCKALQHRTGMTYAQAWAKLNAMYMKGIFTLENAPDGIPNIFVLKPNEARRISSLHSEKGKTNPLSFFSKDNPTKSQSSSGDLSDDQVIYYAIEAGGRLSSASLCVKARIPVEKANKKLEELYAKGIFDVNMNQDGVLVYELIDKDLYRNKR